MLATSVTLPMEMLCAANAMCRQSQAKAVFSIETVAVSSKPIVCHTGMVFSAQKTVDECDFADLIYLPALWRNPQKVITRNPGLLAWLRRHFENGAILSGVGTGCCLLAASGLLDNKPATTHWYYFDRFQKHYPAVQLKRQHFITRGGNIYCAASVNSLADLTVHFIQRFCNRSVAQYVQRHFSHEIRKAYDSISYLEDSNTNHPDENILQAQSWLKSNIAKTISIEELANFCGMSTRNFTRRFKAATGKTPLQYTNELRLSVARELLQASNLSIGEIADKAGFGNPSHFSRVFRRSLSISPREYRATVRAKLFTDQIK
ncbi:MAG: transcriptional regulator GlxA family with amidase domain [Cellvibrionaceae bacterium]|jgi:transcriptional regulator GlxA family with amidase domain